MKTKVSESEASSSDQLVYSRLIALATKNIAREDISKELLSAEGQDKLLIKEYTEQRLKEKKVEFLIQSKRKI